jgi:hypothetical protein
MKYMRIAILIFFFLVNSIGCSSQSINDESFTVNQYEKLGMPNPEKIWQSIDYDKCIVILTDVKKENSQSLPQLNSKKSSILFRRLISPENLLFINDSTIDLQKRAIQLQFITTNFSKLLLLYNQNDNAKQYYSNEVAELIIFGFKITEETFSLMNDVLKNVTVLNEEMKSGIQQLKDGYRKTIIGTLYELERSNQYHVEDLEKLSIALHKNIMTNLKWIDPNVRLEIKEQINKITQKKYSPIVNDKLIEIVKML